MVHRAGRVFRTILGGRPGEVVRRAVRRDTGNVSEQLDGGGVVDTGNSVGAVLGAGAAVQCAVPAVFVPIGGVCGRTVLHVRADAELLCDEHVPFVVHVRDTDG